jgi:hypothetical protein
VVVPEPPVVVPPVVLPVLPVAVPVVVPLVVPVLVVAPPGGGADAVVEPVLPPIVVPLELVVPPPPQPSMINNVASETKRRENQIDLISFHIYRAPPSESCVFG